MFLHVATSDQQKQLHWHMSVVQAEDRIPDAQSQSGDMRTKPPALSTSACGKVSTHGRRVRRCCTRDHGFHAVCVSAHGEYVDGTMEVVQEVFLGETGVSRQHRIGG